MRIKCSNGKTVVLCAVCAKYASAFNMPGVTPKALAYNSAVCGCTKLVWAHANVGKYASLNPHAKTQAGVLAGFGVRGSAKGFKGKGLWVACATVANAKAYMVLLRRYVTRKG